MIYEMVKMMMNPDEKLKRREIKKWMTMVVTAFSAGGVESLNEKKEYEIHSFVIVINIEYVLFYP